MLIIDWLIDQRIPFTAIGRNAERIEKNMRERVVRLESAEYEIVECEHDVDALAKAFSGGKVVCNTVGPFVDFGLTGVEAALRGRLPPPRHHGRAELRDRGAGISSAPTTRRQNLVLAPSTSYMYTHRRDRGRAGARAARRRTCSRPARSAAVRARRPASRSARPRRSSSCSATRSTTCGTTRWSSTRPGKGYELNVPEFVQPVFALPWSGTSLPAFYEHDPRVRYCNSLVGFYDNQIMRMVAGLWEQVGGRVQGPARRAAGRGHRAAGRVDHADDAAARAHLDAAIASTSRSAAAR